MWRGRFTNSTTACSTYVPTFPHVTASDAVQRALTSPPANRHGCWFVGKGGISIHNLVLLSISNDVDDVYEAELDVVLGRYDPVAMLAAAMRRQ